MSITGIVIRPAAAGSRDIVPKGKLNQHRAVSESDIPMYYSFSPIWNGFYHIKYSGSRDLNVIATAEKGNGTIFVDIPSTSRRQHD